MKRFAVTSSTLPLAALLWGMTAAAPGAETFPPRGPYRVIYNLLGPRSAVYPHAGVTVGPAGALYGTSRYGGTARCGTVFKVPETPMNPVIHNFGDQGECSPTGSLAIRNGLIYGTTDQSFGRPGTVFRLTTFGSGYTILHKFDSSAMGLNPENGVIVDAQGTLYGTTSSGGPTDSCPNPPHGGDGVLFKIFQSGRYKVVHAFGNGRGNYPNGIIFGPDGAIYGTTNASCDQNGTGSGLVFRITPTGAYSILYTFGAKVPNAGKRPSGLAFGPNGTLYGVTGTGRESAQFGTVWSLAPGAAGQPWTFIEIHRFTGRDGSHPLGLVVDGAGNLYGTAAYGGAGSVTQSGGTLFRLQPPKAGSSWRFDVLHYFDRVSLDGAVPNGGLILNAGVLYGTTVYGGDNSGGQEFGTVFSYKLD